MDIDSNQWKVKFYITLNILIILLLVEIYIILYFYNINTLKNGHNKLSIIIINRIV